MDADERHANGGGTVCQGSRKRIINGVLRYCPGQLCNHPACFIFPFPKNQRVELGDYQCSVYELGSHIQNGPAIRAVAGGNYNRFVSGPRSTLNLRVYPYSTVSTGSVSALALICSHSAGSMSGVSGTGSARALKYSAADS